MTMLEQTKDAIDKMKQAGFKRSDFRVRSAGYDRKYHVPIGNMPQIISYLPLDKLYAILPEILSQRLTVRLWYDVPGPEFAIKTIIGYEIIWEHYGHDPHLMIEAYNHQREDKKECTYCIKPATIWDEDIPYCDGCCERHGISYWIEREKRG